MGQMRQLATIARTWDKGYGHFTTRQNIQYNWPELQDVPDILDHLAEVEMHAIQTSGTASATSPPIISPVPPRTRSSIPAPMPSCCASGRAAPGIQFLPRKFKIAVTGAPHDRAATQVHDIGLHAKRDVDGKLGFAVFVGGGLGRTPMIGHLIRDFLPEEDLLSYVEAVLRVYNLIGRRDNKYKARIKILVHEAGADEIRRQVEEEWQRIRAGALRLPDDEVRRIEAYFAPPDLSPRPATSVVLERAEAGNPALGRWVEQNTAPHRTTGHAIVTVSLKPIGGTPGDATADQLELIANLAERYSASEVRVSHEQNLILPHVALDDLPALMRRWPLRASPPPMRGWSQTSSPAPGSIIARSPPPARSRSRSGSRCGSPSRSGNMNRRAQDQDLGLHQRLRPSPCRRHRHPRRREEGRGVLPADAGRLWRRADVDRGDHRQGLLLR